MQLNLELKSLNEINRNFQVNFPIIRTQRKKRTMRDFNLNGGKICNCIS